MRLRAIEVHNWGCIEFLSLPDLSDGINLLHGPNRVGKSTLVQAIRSGLFDHFHDSQEATVVAAIPRRTKATPNVIIEFDHAGERYRISKSFAKGREGKTVLEQNTPVGWFTLERGKEASKRVRDLVGIQSSESSACQMLWLGQRDFTLPLPHAVDPTLAKLLESVLGTLITGRDIDFKARLDRACERWYTDKTMNERRNGPLAKLETELEEAIEHKTDVDRLWHETEINLKRYEEALAQQPDLKRGLNDAEQTLDQIAADRQGILVRKSQNDLAVRHRDAETSPLQQAEQQLQAWELTEQRRAEAEKELRDAELRQSGAEERVRLTQGNADQARAALDQAERELADHRGTRGSLDDRRYLAQLAERGHALDRVIDQVHDWLATIRDLESKQAARPSLTVAEIDALRRKGSEAAQLRAQLEAGEIQIVVEALKPLEGAVALDGKAAEEVMLFARAQQEWRIHQQAELTLGKLATVKIRRTTESRDLQRMTQRLTELETECRTALAAARVDLAQPDALDNLLMRRLEHDGHAKELQRLQQALARSAPQGLAALEAQRKSLRDQVDAVLARRPELGGATPSPADLEQQRRDFDEREQRLLGQVDAARKNLAGADTALRTESAAQQKARDQAARLGMELQAAQERLAGRDRASLHAAVADGRQRLADADAKVGETTLSDAERAIEARYQVAVQTRNERDQQLRANDVLLEGLRVKLAGTEGLHQMRNQAEQTVNDLTRELERESLFARAHKHLKELFEEVRQEQVSRTVGPINERVMAWAKQLGLTDYASLAFGDQLLPGGLVPMHAVNGDVIALEAESYGTLEQLSLLIRLAVGGLLARSEPAVALLDDPLAHADLGRHRAMLKVLAQAAQGDSQGPHPTGPVQIILLTCHEERFADLTDVNRYDLAKLIQGSGVRG